MLFCQLDPGLFLAQKVLSFLLQKSFKALAQLAVSLNECLGSLTKLGSPTLLTTRLGYNQWCFSLPIKRLHHQPSFFVRHAHFFGGFVDRARGSNAFHQFDPPRAKERFVRANDAQHAADAVRGAVFEMGFDVQDLMTFYSNEKYH